MEDLNYLLHREQVELLHAAQSDCPAVQASHLGLAGGYARRIDDHRHPYRSIATNGSRSFDAGRYGAGGRAAG
jgi:hypothetical protein